MRQVSRLLLSVGGRCSVPRSSRCSIGSKCVSCAALRSPLLPAVLLFAPHKHCCHATNPWNLAGTSLRYKPGFVTGGGLGMEHDCGTGRAIGWFLEPLACLALWGKKPLTITLR